MKARHEFSSDYDYQKYLRKYFAAMAMQAAITHYGLPQRSDFKLVNKTEVDSLTKGCILCADALLKQLEK